MSLSIPVCVPKKCCPKDSKRWFIKTKKQGLFWMQSFETPLWDQGCVLPAVYLITPLPACQAVAFHSAVLEVDQSRLSGWDNSQVHPKKENLQT